MNDPELPRQLDHLNARLEDLDAVLRPSAVRLHERPRSYEVDPREISVAEKREDLHKRQRNERYSVRLNLVTAIASLATLAVTALAVLHVIE